MFSRYVNESPMQLQFGTFGSRYVDSSEPESYYFCVVKAQDSDHMLLDAKFNVGLVINADKKL